MDVKYENWIAFYFIVAVVHALLLNIFSISFPLFPLVSLINVIYLIVKSKISIKPRALYYYVICFYLSIILFIYYLSFTVFDIKEPFYHLYFIFIIFLCSIYLDRSLSNSSEFIPENKIDFLYCVIMIYFFGSIFLHFTYWDEIARIISKHESLNDLKMDGFIKRCFGLLFNPLSSAFSMLLMFIFLYLRGYKRRLIYFF